MNKNIPADLRAGTLALYLSEVSELLEELDVNEVEKAADALIEARARGSRVWLVGNGGSATTAAHFATDLVKVAEVRAIALNEMMPSFLAYGNDMGWDRAFALLVSKYIKPGDVLVAISCSGTSSNIVLASSKAISRAGKLIVLTGNLSKSTPPPSLYDYKDVAMAVICVPRDNIRVVEDVHLAICHAIVGAIARTSN